MIRFFAIRAESPPIQASKEECVMTRSMPCEQSRDCHDRSFFAERELIDGKTSFAGFFNQDSASIDSQNDLMPALAHSDRLLEYTHLLPTPAP
jgi:hypothetical protein